MQNIRTANGDRQFWRQCQFANDIPWICCETGD